MLTNRLICNVTSQVTILAAMMRPPRSLNCVSNGNGSKLGKQSVESESSYNSEVDEKFDLDHDPVDPNTGFAARFRPLIHWRMILLLSKSFMRGWSSGVYYVLVPYFVQQYGLNAIDVTHLYMVGGVTNIGIRILLIIAGKLIYIHQFACTVKICYRFFVVLISDWSLTLPEVSYCTRWSL